MIKALRALWLVTSTSVRVSPWHSFICLLEATGVLLKVLQPLFLAWIVVGAIDGDAEKVVLAAVAFVASIALEKALCLVGINARIGQIERVGYAFDSKISQITARIPTLNHLESPRYLDQLQTLRDQEGVLGVALNTLLNGFNTVVLVGGTLLLAATVDWRLLLVVAAGAPALLVSRWYVRWEAEAEQKAAQPGRLTLHLLDLGLQPTSGAELRVFGLVEDMRSRLREASVKWRGPFVTQAQRQAVVEVACNVFFYGVTAAVLASIVASVLNGTASLDALVIALILVNRLQKATAEMQESIGELASVVRTASRFLWLMDYERDVQKAHSGTVTPDGPLREGVRLEHLTFSYGDGNGNGRPALHDVSLDLAPGSVIAIVGENGAGKSTLVKLLAGLYRPTSGRILVDGRNLLEFDIAAWRSRISGAFQDYAELEVLARETVGVGDLERIDDEARINASVVAGAAEEVVSCLPRGLETQLGTTWQDGVGLSGGQWQRLALARGLVRDDPLILILDEPTAALDASAEHSLFERYAAATRARKSTGAITILVTHRFSTVAAADRVLVMHNGEITEQGTHHELLDAGGRYAELYKLQARGYS